MLRHYLLRYDCNPYILIFNNIRFIIAASAKGKNIS
ncbi:MAG: hypothetical protein ACI9HU_001842 [Colwellia sp.]